MKKKVDFTIDDLPLVSYNAELAKKELRDKFSQYLMKYGSKKLVSGEIASHDELVKYISLIFEQALELKISKRELEKIESRQTKLAFLQYSKTADDNFIHDVAYRFIALCNGDKKAVESVVSPWPILDCQGNKLSIREGLDWENSRALCKDVAELTKQCVKEFLQELRETGKIMTSAELAEHQQVLAASATEEDKSYTDDEFENDSDDVNSVNPATADTSTADNQEVQTRSILSVVSDEETKATNDQSKEDKVIEGRSEEGPNPTSLLNHMLSWIHQLPEYLQSQILNSTPVKALIEAAEQMAAIYDVKAVEAFLAKFLPAEPEVVTDSAENDMSDKVMVSESSTDAIDMDMLLEEPAVNGWILPMVDVNSGFNNDHILNEMAPFHGHGFDIF